MLGLLKPRWLDLLLVLALASLALYLWQYSSLSAGSPWASLWPNITTDLAFGWLAVRVIDGILKLRQSREEVVRGVRAGANFAVRIAVGLLPDLYAWSLRDLRDETRWFRLRLEYQGHLLRKDELARANAVVERLTPIIDDAEKLTALRREASRCEEDMRSKWQSSERAPDAVARPLHDVESLGRVERENRAYIRQEEPEPARLLVAIEEARRAVAQLDLGEELMGACGSYLSALQLSIERQESLKSRAEESLSFVRDTEVMLLNRVRG